MHHVCICLGQFTNFSWMQTLRVLPIDTYARASSTSESNPFQCAHHSRHLTTNHTQPDYARQHIILGNFVKDVSGFFTDHHDRPILDCANFRNSSARFTCPPAVHPWAKKMYARRVTLVALPITNSQFLTVIDAVLCSGHTSTIAYIAMSYIAIIYRASKHVELLTKET